MGLENIHPEVAKKIKSAIKAKLTELGAYVDDELPDYIMLLVGNKKAKDKMDEDLKLFLGRNTEKFTSWLLAVLEKINEASSENNNVKEDEQKSDPDVAEETPASALPVDEKKKHKKKKDKKEKKEKKKKKDKEKKSSKRSKSDKASSCDKESTSLEESKNDPLVSVNSKKTIMEGKPKEIIVIRHNVQSGNDCNDSPEEGEVEQEDQLVRETRGDDELEEKEKEDLKRKSKLKLLSREVKNLDYSDTPNIKVVISNPKSDKHETHTNQTSTVVNVHDRLGPLPSQSTTKKIINLREESSFPLRSSGNNNDGSDRVISSSIVSSGLRSTIVKPDMKPTKKLEARVRPLISSSQRKEEPSTINRLSGRLSSKVQKRSHSEDEFEDDEKPSAKKLSGAVAKVEAASRPKRTGRAHANSALILKAVADAHKSVSKSKRPAEDMEPEAISPKKEKKVDRERQGHRVGGVVDAVSDSIQRYAVTIPNTVVIKDKTGDRTSDGEVLEYYEERKLPKKPRVSSSKSEEHRHIDAEDTRFIITMDAFDNEIDSTDLRAKLNAKRSPSVDEEEFIEEIEEWEEIVEEAEVPQEHLMGQQSQINEKVTTKIDNTSSAALKKEERCRYWPNCKEGSACQFVHPSKICITFPNCRFGDKCLYIHPKCKFDVLCTKPNCPFKHSTKKAVPVVPVAAKTVSSAIFNPAMVKCRYYPKCTDMNCPYLHPKTLCRYGKACQNPACLFVHPEFKITTGSLLKWTAKSAAPTNGASSVKSSILTST